MNKNWHKVLAATAVFTLLLSGCGQSKPPAQGAGETPPANMGQGSQQGTDTPPQTATPAPNQEQNKQMKVKTYYSDSNFEKLIEKETTISYKQDADKYRAALESLKTSPDNQSLTLFKGFTFNKVDLKDGQITIDLSMAPESHLGSGGEDMLLNALQKTLFQFSEIQAIEVLVDGEQVESLMGHMDLPHPIKRN
ncbi:spore germination protein GerM [Paenibacillus sp. PvR052]|uniref:GerMN domain-containing protein n=1 Tax=Paenibacillus sp. PvP091 TaxID=2806590 RepID=UPI001AE7BB05|nr:MULTISPECIES: GerMN domain-containing protein [unclassified Paenibacillus]MBP1155312.1 spore germination protein GerM [Paenibacillus sp. PvP091]MBP1169304.1 spore germination protein GerM [Paenibacillus sp. PvR098]MBP2440332.1 spore germination protein GerM [Paenibacillus sp. PvP052]